MNRWIGFIYWGCVLLCLQFLFSELMDRRMRLVFVLYGFVMLGYGIWTMPDNLNDGSEDDDD